MPRDRTCTGDSQAKAEEESQNEFRMRELFNTLLDRHPRIPLGIDTSSGSRLGHLFRGVGAECCRGQDAYKGNDSDRRDCAQRPPGMAIRGVSNKNYVRRVHFSLDLSFLASRKPTPFCANASYLQHAIARFTAPTS